MSISFQAYKSIGIYTGALLLCLLAGITASSGQSTAFPVREMSSKLYGASMSSSSIVLTVSNDQRANMLANPSTFPATVAYKSNHTIVSLAIDHGATLPPSVGYVYKMAYTLEGATSMTSAGFTFSVTDTLVISYSPDSLGAYQDIQIKTYPDLFDAKLTITGLYDITAGGPPVPLSLPAPKTNFYVELSMKYQPVLLTHYTPAAMALNTSHSYDVPRQQLLVNWTPATTPLFLGKVTPAQYELEWTYVDNYAPNGSALPIAALQYNFKRNATRILTDSTGYAIPVIYPKGYLVYRVRMIRVENSTYKSPIYGAWSVAATSGSVGSLTALKYFQITTPHSDDALNWNYTIHFAEGGKYKHVMGYFDGMLKNRQTITRFNTNPGQLLATEQIYDYEGRPAITTLPTVIQTPGFGYQSGVSTSSVTGRPYAAADFDLKPSLCPDAFTIPAFATASLANRYYSPLNTDTAGMQKFVPQAEGYPFIHNQLAAGYSDRVEASGNAGPVLQVNKGHDTRNEYMQADQPDLNNLFGINAGRSSFYTKTMTKDPNGQNSMTVTDYKGKQILSSLVGASVDTTQIAILFNDEVPPARKFRENKLADSASNHTVGSNKIYGGSFYMDFDAMSNIKYEYAFKPFMVCPAPAYRGLSVKCSYDYDIHDNCGVERLHKSGVLGVTGVTTSANATPFTEDTSLLLQKGKYTVRKTLTIADGDVTAAVDSFFKFKPSCMKSEDDFIREAVERNSYPCPVDDECSKIKAKMMEELFTGAKYGKWRPGGSVVVIGGSSDPNVNSIYDIPQYLPGGDTPRYRFEKPCVKAALNALVITKGRNTYKNIGGPLLVIDSSGKETTYYAENDIVTFFKDEIYTGTDKFRIAEALLPLHPEYCKLLACFEDTLEKRLKAIPDAATAIKYNLFNLDSLVAKDVQLRSRMLVAPFNYTYIADSLRLMNGGLLRMDTVAAQMAFCLNDDVLVYGDAKNFFRNRILGLNFPSTQVKDAYFNHLRTFYLFNRTKYVSMAKTGAGTNCPPCDSTARMKLIPEPVIEVPYSASGSLNFGPDGMLGLFSDSSMAKIKTFLTGTSGMPADTAGSGSMKDSATRIVRANDSVLCSVAVDSIMGRMANCFASGASTSRLKDSLLSYVRRGIVHNGVFLPEQLRAAIVSAGLSLNDLCHPYLANYDYYQEGVGARGNCYAPSFYTAAKDFFNEPTINTPLKSINSATPYVTTPAWPSANFFAMKIADGISGGSGSIKYAVQYFVADSLYVCSFFKTGSDTVKISFRSPKNIRSGSSVIPFLLVSSTDSAVFRSVDCFFDGGSSVDGHIGRYMFFAVIDRIVNESGSLITNKGQFLAWNNAKIMMNDDGSNQLASCVPCTQFRTYFKQFADSMTLYGGFAQDHPLFGLSLRNYMNYRLKKVFSQDQYSRFLSSCALADSMRIPLYGGYAQMSFPTSTGTAYATFADWQSALGLSTGIIAPALIDYKVGSVQQIVVDYSAVPFKQLRAMNEKVLASGGVLKPGPGTNMGRLWLPVASSISTYLSGTPFTVVSNTAVKVKASPYFPDEEDYKLYVLSDTSLNFSRISRGVQLVEQKLYDSGLLAYWMPYSFPTINADYYKPQKQGYLKYAYSMQSLPASKVLDTLQDRFIGNNIAAFSGTQVSYINPKNAYRFTDLYYTDASSRFPGYDTVVNVLAYAQSSLGAGKIFLPGATSKLTVSGGPGSGANLILYRCADGLYWYRYFDKDNKLFNIFLRVPGYVYQSAHNNYKLVGIKPATGDTSSSSFQARITVPGSNDTILAAGTTNINLAWSLKLRDVVLGNEADFGRNKEKPASGETGSVLNCEQQRLRNDTYEGRINYYNYITKYREDLLAAFRNHVMSQIGEKLWIEYVDMRFGTTLYTYDRVGNLIRTVPPEGVRKVDSAMALKVDSLRAGNIMLPAALPRHLKSSIYEYNTANRPWKETTPDAGTKIMYYDKKGNILLSQSQKQRLHGLFTYFLYDPQNRLTETGEVTWNIDCPYFDPIPTYNKIQGTLQYVPKPFTCACENTRDSLWEYCGPFKLNFYDDAGFNAQIRTKDRSQVVYTVYDSAFRDLPATGVPNLSTQENLRSRIAATMYYPGCKPGLPDSTFEHAMHFSYDAAGNVTTLTREFPQLTGMKQRYKRIDYEYDLWSGKTNMISYNRGMNDQFYQRYQYDADNRITTVETSRDGFIWRRDAGYTYYQHGPLARTSLGDRRVQGVDYAYTLQGWLKAINGDKIDTTADMGRDGIRATIVPKDAYAGTIDYFTGDYKAIGNTKASRLLPHNKSLYNGNIARQSADVLPFGGLTTAYTYDQMNRIKQARYAKTLRDSALTYLNQYASAYKYDMDGNLKLLVRKDGAGVTMDSLAYRYANPNDNKMTGLEELVGYTAPGIEDIKHGGAVHYDEDGNLRYDYAGNIEAMDWNIYGKATGINRLSPTKAGPSGMIYFGYDAMGQRSYKTESLATDSGTLTRSTFYVREAGGNILAEYNVRKQYDKGGYIKSLPVIRSTYTGSALKRDWTLALDQLGYLVHPAFSSYILGHTGMVTIKPVSFYLAGDPSLTYSFVSGEVVNALRSYSTTTGRYPVAEALQQELLYNFQQAMMWMSNGLLGHPDPAKRDHALVQLLERVPDLYIDIAAQNQLTVNDPNDSIQLFQIVKQAVNQSPYCYIDPLYNYFQQDNTVLDSWLRALSTDDLYSADQWYDQTGFNYVLRESLRGHSDMVAEQAAQQNGTSKAEEGIFAFADWWGGSNDLLNSIAPSLVSQNRVTYFNDPVQFLTSLSGYELMDTALSLIEADLLTVSRKFLGTELAPWPYTLVARDPAIVLQDISLASHHIYGSSRIGVHTYWPEQYRNIWDFKETRIDTALNKLKPWYSFAVNAPVQPGFADPWGHSLSQASDASHVTGLRQYELTNQLGNVQAVVSDNPYLKIGGNGQRDYFSPALHAAYDYYPYGMLMPGRNTADTGSYCFTTTKIFRNVIRTRSSLYLGNAQPLGKNTTLSSGTFVPGLAATGTWGGMSLEIDVTPGETIDITADIGYVASFALLSVEEAIPGGTRMLASSRVNYPSRSVLSVLPTGNKVIFKVVSGGGTVFPRTMLSLVNLETETITYEYKEGPVTICNKLNDKYEFGFNGQLKDNEVAGIGNWTNFDERMYSNRLGRFPTRDPMIAKFPGQSPYVFAGNSPILNIDQKGAYKVSSAEKYADYMNKYPVLMAYFQTQIKADVLRSAKLIEGLQQFWEQKTGSKPSVRYLTKNVLNWGSGPDIEFTDNPGGVSNARGGYDPETNTIYLNSTRAKALNNLLKNSTDANLKKVEFMRFFMTVIHETGHKMNYPDSWNDGESDARRPKYTPDQKEQFVKGIESGNYTEDYIWGYDDGLGGGYDPTNLLSKDKDQPGVVEGVIKNAEKTPEGSLTIPSIPNP